MFSSSTLDDCSKLPRVELIELIPLRHFKLPAWDDLSNLFGRDLSHSGLAGLEAALAPVRMLFCGKLSASLTSLARSKWKNTLCTSKWANVFRASGMGKLAWTLLVSWVDCEGSGGGKFESFDSEKASLPLLLVLVLVLSEMYIWAFLGTNINTNGNTIKISKCKYEKKYFQKMYLKILKQILFKYF